MSRGAPFDAAALAALAASVVDIARRAGDEILAVYAQGAVASVEKADRSPLTEADLRAHRLIDAELRALTPDVPVLSEESRAVPFEERSRWPRYWLVDPLDGTKEFLSRNGEFTVNVALIEGHAPALGVVHVPVRDTTYWGVVGWGAWRRAGGGGATPIRVSARAASPLRVVGSRSHRDATIDGYLSRVGPHELVPIGSSLKFCLVAEGGADLYPRFGPTSEWDTAAAQAVVEAAGGAVVRLDGRPLDYNAKADLLNPHFIVYGSRDRDWVALHAPA